MRKKRRQSERRERERRDGETVRVEGRGVRHWEKRGRDRVRRDGEG